MCKTYTKEDFGEDCPRFIPMKYESEIYENGESVSWYIFDTEKLDFIGGIVPYYDYQEAEKVCNIFNGVSYIFKGDVKLEGKESLLELAEYVDKLQEENEQLKKQKARYKRLSEIRNEEINNRILTIKEFIDNCSNEKVKKALEDLFYSEVNEYDLSKKYRKLNDENKNLKLENIGLKYALKYIKEINVEIEVDDFND